MEEATRLKEIVRDEAQKKVWASIHRELQQTRNPSQTRVKVPLSDGTTREYVTKEQIEEAIGGQIDMRFSKVDIVQVCQGALFELLGHSVDTEAAIAILKALSFHRLS